MEGSIGSATATTLTFCWPLCRDAKPVTRSGRSRLIAVCRSSSSGTRRALSVGAFDAQRRAHTDRDVGPRDLELDALDAAVALRRLRFEGNAVERRGLAQHARERVVFDAAEGQTHAAGHAGEVVEAGDLVGHPDRLDDVEPRPGIRRGGSDLTEGFGQQCAGRHAPLRSDDLLVRAAMLAERTPPSPEPDCR